ncbi:hypothetical protein [Paraburkholderia kururiensis]|uniref:hypothetical protein n=1 Tax=Paraburkholderia kururiensis TaxID=984307 RepID=UPI000F879A56|nr:hypothetical protein [Paraburkholderia kururiensis]
MGKASQQKKSSRARKLGTRDLEALRRGAVRSGIPDAIVLDRNESALNNSFCSANEFTLPTA